MIPMHLPKQKQCRLDHYKGSLLLIDTATEEVLFVGNYPDRTLGDVYLSMRYYMASNLPIDTYIKHLTSKQFKRFNLVNYK